MIGKKNVAFMLIRKSINDKNMIHASFEIRAFSTNHHDCTHSCAPKMGTQSLSTGRKFQVLSWKLFKLKCRHYIETILDILIPSLLFIGEILKFEMFKKQFYIILIF